MIEIHSFVQFLAIVLKLSHLIILLLQVFIVTLVLAFVATAYGEYNGGLWKRPGNGGRCSVCEVFATFLTLSVRQNPSKVIALIVNVSIHCVVNVTIAFILSSILFPK